jgi:hypothetical protein
MAEISVQGGDAIATEDFIRHGKRSVPIIVVSGGMTISGFTHYAHKISDVASLEKWAAEFENEKEHFEGGSETLKMYDGKSWSSTLELEGNALESAAAMIGQNIKTYPSLQFGVIHDKCCHLLIIAHDTSVEKNLLEALIVTDIGVKLDVVPGVAPNTEETYTISLYTKGRVFRVHGGHCPSFEIFYDNAENIKAPNGVLVDFFVGDGNHSYSSALAGAVALKVVDPDAVSTLYQYCYFFKLNGVDQSPNQVSFNSTTKKFTFVTAPPALSKIEFAVCVDKAGSPGVPAHLWATSDMRKNWKNVML